MAGFDLSSWTDAQKTCAVLVLGRTGQLRYWLGAAQDYHWGGLYRGSMTNHHVAIQR